MNTKLFLIMFRVKMYGTGGQVTIPASDEADARERFNALFPFESCEIISIGELRKAT